MKRGKAIDPLADVRRCPTKVKRVRLHPAAALDDGEGVYEELPRFPRELLACRNLVDLVIFRGIVDGRIPRERACGGCRRRSAGCAHSRR
jgi:hypothetical protein